MSARTADDVPPPLAQRIGASLAGAPADADAIMGAALERLRVALALGDEREAAYELLTADALITQAAAAAARAGADPVVEPQSFAALLERNA